MEIQNDLLLQEHKFIYDEIVYQNTYGVKQEDIENKTVIDCGANVGIFSALASTYRAKNIIAVEPIPSNLTVLRDTMDRYTQSDVKIVPKAVHWRSDYTIQIVDKGGQSHEVVGSGIKVPTISFADILRFAPKGDNDIVLKVDNETGEYPLFYGTPIHMFRRISTIFIEIHGSSRIENGPFAGNREALEVYIQYILGFEMVEKNEMYIYYPDGSKKPTDVCTYRFNRK